MSNSIAIARRIIGPGHKTFMIAEAGVNHNGDAAIAIDLIRAAKRAGADCVKFQTFKAERVVMADAPKANYQTRVTDPDESQLDMLRKLELSPDTYAELIEVCAVEEIIFSSTPYNEEDIAFLDKLNIPIFKAASIHLAEPHFLRCMANTGRPLIVSTGMATWDEISLAVDAIRSTGNEQFVLLQCTTNYPSSINDTNLRAMAAMGERFGCLIGYSDHTQDHVSCLGAVALGACLIEKHFTLDKNLPGPDHTTSETPEGFAGLVNAVRTIEAALGTSDKKPTAAERSNMEGMRRSVVAKHDMRIGHVIRDDDLICKRPATGIAPSRWNELVGKSTKCDIPAGAMLNWDDLDV